MKLRLHGTPAECQAAATLLRQVPGLHLCDQSPPYPDRSGELVRVYLTAQLGPVTVTPDLGRAPGGDQR